MDIILWKTQIYLQKILQTTNVVSELLINEKNDVNDGPK